MNTMKLNAYAKVNLCLDVLRKREDGYHEVRMIMQNLDIYDELSFEVLKKNSDNTFSIKLVTNKDSIPTDERNLVYKAIKLMFETYNIGADIVVTLTKNIPVEAGMAGGSTDCAAAIKAVNELFGLGLSTDELMDLGVKLGADVPFCILGKTALSEGIGEVLTPINPLPMCHVVVAKPPINVSTKMVYTNLKVDSLEYHPDVDGMLKGLSDNDLDKIASCMDNVLETVTTKLYPEIEEIKKLMIKHGAKNSLMSGSGPTVFGLFEDEGNAKACVNAIIDEGMSKEVFLTKPV